MLTISGSVGLRGANKTDDTRLIQNLLNANRPRVAGAREIKVDGIVGPKTIRAIKAFQTDVLKYGDPDAVIDPGGKTWQALTGVKTGGPVPQGPKPVTAGHADPAAAPSVAPNLIQPILFPMRRRPGDDYHLATGKGWHHHRYFGAPRKDKHGNYRAHAGVDLIAGDGVAVLAVDKGQVRRFEPGFFENTAALTIKHDNKLEVRYGEIRVDPRFTQKGAPVERGQVIGSVQLNLDGTSMLHIEFYGGTQEGPCTVYGRNSFNRRGDLFNPTALLDAAEIDPRRG